MSVLSPASGAMPEGFPAPWASDWGRDRIGFWQSLTCRGVRQAFRWCPPGTFLMGSPESEEGRNTDEHLHEVTLTRGFWLGETACTQALWEAVAGQNPSRFKGGQRPVERVSWEAAQQFIGQLNQELAAFASRRAGSGNSSFQPAGFGAFPEASIELRFRLPTESEWEYACRAGTTAAYSFGDHIDRTRANFDAEETVDVTSLPVNAWGLHEVHGNVWEWCEDWKGKYPWGPVTDPSGPATGELRVLRGGSWTNSAPALRSASRVGDVPYSHDSFVGFRLAFGTVHKQEDRSGV